MEELKETRVFKFNPNTLQEVRNLFNLDNSGRMEEALRLLEDWIQKQGHFVCKKFDRAYLERHIIYNKGLLERAKIKLDNLCTFRTLLPEYFGYCDIREVFNVPHYTDVWTDVIMTKLTHDHYRVYLLTGKNFNLLTPEIIVAYIRSIFLSWEYVFKHDYNAGFIIINDLRNINILDIISKINITFLRHFYGILTEGYGLRIKGLHFITNSRLVAALADLVKKVVSAKLATRLHYHASLDSLYEMVPKEVLCADYGGNEMPLAELRDLWTDTLASDEHIEHMKHVNNQRTDEFKRIGEKISDIYLPGSFRSLVVD